MNELKKTLFDNYDGFADKRIKNLDSGNLFIIDDRTEKDIGADKQLFPYFCLMFAEVQSDGTIKIILRGNVPMGPLVKKWISENNCEFIKAPQGSLSFVVEKGETKTLTDLAKAFHAIVAHGKRNKISNYKIVCPRTVKSLLKLRGVLSNHWNG